MARWTGQPTTEAILEAAKLWRDRCLVSDGSVLTASRAWTRESAADLHARVGAAADPDVQGFDARLAHQVMNAPVATRVMAAELLWLLLLYPSGQYLPETKRRKVMEVLGPAGLAAPDATLLSDAVLDGIGAAGSPSPWASATSGFSLSM